MREQQVSRRAAKERISTALTLPDVHACLEALGRMPSRQVIRSLFSSLCETNTAIKVRAVRVMGILVAKLAEKDMDEAREVMRRLMWYLNEESGNSGWGAPEAMAEIMARHQGLANEYTHILVSYMREDGNYLENPRLQRGLLMGIERLAQCRADLLLAHGAGYYLPSFLESEDAEVRALAAGCIGVLDGGEVRKRLQGRECLC